MLDIRDLRDELKEAGLFEKREGNTWFKVLGLMTLLGGLITAHVMLPLWASVLLMPVSMVVTTTISLYGHEGGHRSLSRSNFRNDLLLYLTFPLFSGLGALYWQHKHNVKHHNHTNIQDEDPDLELWPMAASVTVYNRSGRFQRWFQRNFQGPMFWPLTFMLAYSMRASSIEYTLRFPRENKINRRWVQDVLCLLGHYTLWLGGGYFFFGWWGLLFYFVLWSGVGFLLASIFAPAHMSLPVLSDHSDRWRLQFDTTRNLGMSKLMSWFFVGLDHQIEHHLFPAIPHQHMHAAAEITQRWAARNNVPYYKVEFFTGMADVSRYMKEAWHLDPTSEQDQASWAGKSSEVDLTLAMRQEATQGGDFDAAAVPA